MFAPTSHFVHKFYSEKHEITQILLRISEKKYGGWGSGNNLAQYSMAT